MTDLRRVGKLWAASFAVGAGLAAAAPCTDPAALTAARQAIASACPCDAAPNHGAYHRCAGTVLRAVLREGQLPGACVRSALRCASHSTCGRPEAVTCCRPTSDGTGRCVIARSAEQCAARGGCAGVFPSCCDACDGGACVTTTTTTSTTTTTIPVCGNGAVEAGEQCDSPLRFCTADCHLVFTLCCQVGPNCGLVLSGSGCLFAGGSLHPGEACGPGCVGQAVPLTPICCQLPNGCVDDIVSSSEQFADFALQCYAAGGPETPTLPTGTCGGDGQCTAAP